MIIVGISAKKQGGKSTLIEAIISQLPEGHSKVVRFADTLKQIVLDCFVPSEMNLNHPDDLDSDEAKNIMLPCGKTIRQMLQLIGTDWFRHIWGDCWINTFKNTIRKSKASFIFVPDCRFPNELKAIQEMDGKVIRLMRAPFAFQDQHESETALDEAEENSLAMTNAFFTAIEEKFGVVVAAKSLSNSFIVHDVRKEGRGHFFDAILDNRNMSLESSQVWAANFVKKCFSWNGNSKEIWNPEFDLTKLGE